MEAADTGVPSTVLENIHPCGIHVDEEGDWYHGETRIVRDDIIELFLENLRLAPDGAYLIEWNQALCALDAADAVFVVSRVDREKEEDSANEKMLLTLKHLSHAEPLDPATLRVGKNNVMYCRVREGRFLARFSRPAYYQLADMIQEDEVEGVFCLELNGIRFPVRMEDVG